MAETRATEKRTSQGLASGKGDANTVTVLTSVQETGAVVADGDTIYFGNVPSNARFLGTSKVYWDDLATSGSPTLDIGLGAVDGNLANSDDPDALSNGHAVSATTTSGASAISEINNIGTPAWDLVASETSDPGGVLKVYGSIVDAATTQAGTIVLELHYLVD